MNKNFRRSKLEMYIDILEAIADGLSKPTRIMYAANTSWLPLQEALKVFLQKGFIIEAKIGERRRYVLTEKGFSVLSYFKRVKEEFELQEIKV